VFQDSTPVLPTPLLLAVAFGVAAVASLFAGAVSTPRHATVGLALVAVACAGVARRGSGLRTALLLGPVFWLFADAFVEHRDGVLGWNPSIDPWYLPALVAVAALPALGRGVVGLWTARRRFRRASLEWFEPEMPARRHPSAWN
jgi:hypothetical protein